MAEDDRKIVLFSEWTTMLGLVEGLIEKHGTDYVRLDGSVPQKQRQPIVRRFQSDRGCRLFITTNAGATGLNLQAANTVVNVDLPWNPAVLEQRISRAHRMGQQRPVQVFVLVTEGTIEESLLTTLSAKHELAMAALDADSDVDAVDLVSGSEELKSRLEVLLGAKPDAPVDESEKTRQETAAAHMARREQIALAGGQLLGAGGLVGHRGRDPPVPGRVQRVATPAACTLPAAAADHAQGHRGAGDVDGARLARSRPLPHHRGDQRDR